MLPAVLLAVIINAPRFFESNVDYIPDGEGDFRTVLKVTRLRLHPTYMKVSNWGRALLIRIIPFLLIAGLSLYLFIATRRMAIGSDKVQHRRTDSDVLGCIYYVRVRTLIN